MKVHSEDDRPAIRIRRAAIDDAEAIAALEAMFPSDRMSMRSIRRFLSVPTARVWVAELNGVVVGNLIWLSRRGSRAARIYSVAVAAEARGRGLAQALVAAMEVEAQAAGCDRASLEVRADNAAAIGLYAKLGFIESQRLPGYYDDGADGLRMLKLLR